MRNINVQGNVVKSREFGFFVQEFRLHWLATMNVRNDNSHCGSLRARVDRVQLILWERKVFSQPCG